METNKNDEIQKFIDFLTTLANDGAMTTYQVEYICTCLFDNPNIVISDVLKQYSLTSYYNDYLLKNKINKDKDKDNGKRRIKIENKCANKNATASSSSNVREREMQNIEYACAQNRDRYKELKIQLDLINGKLADFDKGKMGDSDKQRLKYLEWRAKSFPENPAAQNEIDQIKQRYKQSPVELALLQSQRDIIKNLEDMDIEYDELCQRKDMMS